MMDVVINLWLSFVKWFFVGVGLGIISALVYVPALYFGGVL